MTRVGTPEIHRANQLESSVITPAKLERWVALVTGGSSGLGLATAHR